MGAYNKDNIELPDFVLEDKIKQIILANDPNYKLERDKYSPIKMGETPNPQRDIARLGHILLEIVQDNNYFMRFINKELEVLYAQVEELYTQVEELKKK